jgi:RNA polymerase sigma factor (TIGR02999 family)
MRPGRNGAARVAGHSPYLVMVLQRMAVRVVSFGTFSGEGGSIMLMEPPLPVRAAPPCSGRVRPARTSVPSSPKPANEGSVDITGYLRAVRDGGRGEMDALFAAVYEHLRTIARRRMRFSRDASMSATGLVHEAYLRIAETAHADWRDRQHFFAAAARAMRHIVVDRARRRGALKRGAGAPPETLDEERVGEDARLHEALAVDQALTRIAEVDPRLVQIVELCFFVGLTTDEAGEVLGVSARTVKREWAKARILLQAMLGDRGADGA